MRILIKGFIELIDPPMLRWYVCLFTSVFIAASICKKCDELDESKYNMEVVLEDADISIDEIIWKFCPRNVSRLMVRELTPTVLRRIKMSEFNSEKFPFLVELHVSVRQLKIVSDDCLATMPSALKKVSLSNCGIEVLPILGIFSAYPDLRVLDLSLNSLSRLPPDLLMYSHSMRHLNLSFNKLTFIPKITDAHVNSPGKLVLDITGNPIKCSCTNSWLSSGVSLNGLKNCTFPGPCRPLLSVRASHSIPSQANDSTVISVLASQSTSFSCEIDSSLPFKAFWYTPIGVISVEGNRSYMLSVQPLIAKTALRVIRLSDSINRIEIDNVRGYFIGGWHCVALSDVDIHVSQSIDLRVHSSIFYSNVYRISLWYGYGAMVVLLLIGIVGGTIRYCKETHCMRRPQPQFAYGGKTFIGVIPVPEIEEDIPRKNSNSEQILDTNSTNQNQNGQTCDICHNPPTYWFCVKCESLHFAECFYGMNTSLTGFCDDMLTGYLACDGEIRTEKIFNTEPSTPTDVQSILEVHRPLMLDLPNERFYSENLDSKSSVCVRSGFCVIKVCGLLNRTEDSGSSGTMVSSCICVHRNQRPSSADVKLVVSNDRLAEEYREALADLARAVDGPDVAHFNENLEAFRNRLIRDVGKRVKVLRGEFQGLRAKSAKSVANLRNQSSAAAQRMREGISYRVEQVKDSMRSMAELCGASSKIGQTISVVSIYVDEADQMKKERFISDFVF